MSERKSMVKYILASVLGIVVGAAGMAIVLHRKTQEREALTKKTTHSRGPAESEAFDLAPLTMDDSASSPPADLLTLPRPLEIVVRSEKQRIYTIVVTGGPGSGKTEAMMCLTSVFENQSFDVYTVPEMYGWMIKNGCKIGVVRSGLMLNVFERNLMKVRKAAEDMILATAASTKWLSIVIMDGGLLDPKVFVKKEAWNEILAMEGVSESDLLKRYDLVFHLTTPAVDHGTVVSSRYTQFTRRSDAVEQDRLMKEAYALHPNHPIIPHGPLKDKLNQITEHAKACVQQWQKSNERNY